MEQGPQPQREITPEQVQATCAAFLIAHEGCGDAVEFGRFTGTLVCHCAVCGETITYRVRQDRREP